MPENTTVPSGSVSLADAPGGDLDLDALFGNPEVPATTPTAQPEPQATTPSDEPFLKTATGTVYKTADDAVKGVEHKDALITQLRQQLAEATGADPLKKNQPHVNGPVNYVNDKDAYFKDLSKAVEDKDSAKYIDVQRKFVYDSIAPLAPTITALVKSQAVNAVEAELKDFREFQLSSGYSETLDSLPLLKDAIRVAESSPETAAQLPELYKVAYLAGQGRKLPEIVRTQPREGVVARPTVTSNPLPAAAPQTQTAAPSLETREGRKAIIEQMERAGIDKTVF